MIIDSTNTETAERNSLAQPVGTALPDWKACARPSREPMVGRFCRLVALNPADHGADLYQAFGSDSSQRNWTYLPYGPFANQAECMDWMSDTCCGDDPLFYTVVENSTSRVVGIASYLRIEPAVGVIETGHIHFSPLMQRTAVSTEAFYLMMKRVFDELGYRRYEWKCDALNEPSKRAAKRLGFQFEGIFRQATIYKARNRDTAWLSIIDTQWPQRREAFERWLRADNFDASGRQKNSLERFKV